MFYLALLYEGGQVFSAEGGEGSLVYVPSNLSNGVALHHLLVCCKRLPPPNTERVSQLVHFYCAILSIRKLSQDYLSITCLR